MPPLMLLVLGCGAPDVDDVSMPVSEPVATPPTVPPDPDAPQPVVEEGEIGDMDAADPAGWLFDDTVLHEIEIDLPQESGARLNAEPYEWVPASVTIDGQVIGDVGVRLRGKIGSFRELSDKPKLGIDFNAFVPGREFYGLERINLNNSVGDCSLLREPLAYRVYGEAGVQVPRLAFATVSVSGQYKGLYHLIEHPDDEWLQTAYPPGDGNLYDGKYVYNGSFFADLIDFTPEQQDDFQLEEGVDVGRADVHAITTGLRVWENGVATYADMNDLIAFEQLHPYLAAEHYTLNWDGYALNTNNYRVYFDSVDGRMRMVPTDLDLSFPDFSWWDWRSPQGRIVDDCWADAACAADQRLAVDALLDHLDTIDLRSQLDAWATLTGAVALQEPFLDCSSPGDDRDFLRDWVVERPAEMRADWGL